MKYGYCRCSTDISKQDVDRQVRDLVYAGVDRNNICYEYASGSTRRKMLDELLEKLQPGDELVATEQSRISRSIKDLIDILEFAKERRVKLTLGSMVVDCTKDQLDPATEGAYMFMGVAAQIERTYNSQRIKSGLENAKAKGQKLGRPRTTKEDIPDIFWKYYQMYKEIDPKKRIGITEMSKLMECSRPTIYKYIKLAEN